MFLESLQKLADTRRHLRPNARSFTNPLWSLFCTKPLGLRARLGMRQKRPQNAPAPPSATAAASEAHPLSSCLQHQSWQTCTRTLETTPLCRHLQRLAHSWLLMMGRHFPELGQSRTKVGRNCAEIVQFRATSRRARPISCRSRPGPSRSIPGRVWLSSIESGHKTLEVVQHSDGIGPNLGDSGPNWPIFAGICVKLGHTWPEFD